ncbi:MAB_1171c family putative transporter [Streptomyces sp. MUM 178J]|uniref:MAB_1171c family putative transporter n=1 Tax=Streptomyces sp. MUM 178J TaxID=2791991 RepID=UPI001F0345EE|nr:MAB_1171c family putative transporter [Streptomyces sp. MUM 178J]WRQ81264.1 MAB_1171c family putative transporter [Streptomyces sp. MUM 178J]
MQQLLHPICLTLAVTGFLLLCWPPRHLRQDRALAALAGVYGFSALSFLVSLEPVWRLLDDITGRPSTGILGAFGSVVALLALQPVVLAYWALPPDRARKRARVCLAAGAGVIAALAVLFFQLTPAGRTTPQGFTANYIHTGVYQAYLTLYIVAYTVGETVLAVGCWTAARRTDQVWVARGLRVVGIGALMTFGYSAVRLAGVGASLLDLTPPSADAESFAWICADGGTTLTLAGFFIPTVAVHAVPNARAWIRAHRDYRRLAPLWKTVHRAMPTIALQPARTDAVARLRVWDINWRLYRRAVEIRDGQWALQQHLDESVRRAAEQRHRAAGLTGAELASAVTADQLRAALTAYRRDESPQTPTEYADAETRDDVRTPDDDVRALLRIAARFDTEPAQEEAAPSWT